MKRIWMMVIASIFVITSCGPSTAITHSWKATDAGPKKFSKMVVLAMVREQGFREKMEQHIVSDLATLGYNAVCSCDEYSPKAFEGMSEVQAIAKLRNSGVDAVLTVVLLDKQKERYYVPGRMYYSPYYVSHNHFWPYYQNMHNRIYTEGYYVTNTKYFWESNLYDLKGDQLLYSAQSTSFDPASGESLAHEYGQMIVKNMVKQNVIGETKKGF